MLELLSDRDLEHGAATNLDLVPQMQVTLSRRQHSETIDHADAASAIEDPCSTCHMPMARYTARQRGETGRVFADLPLASHPDTAQQAEDGVSCSLCHQIGTARLGTPASFSGQFVVDPPDTEGNHHEYGLLDGFDKRTAEPDIAVIGTAANDPDFTGAGDQRPFRVAVELLYQPIGFRWAQNLKQYSAAPEPRRFTGYYDATAGGATTVLASASK